MILFLLVFSISKTTNAQIQLNVLEQKTLRGVPSASGITIINDSIFVIGDNSPFVFHLNKTYKIISNLQVQKLENTDTLFPKSIKPDFEAFEVVSHKNKHTFYIFGSGSKSPHRDVFFTIDNFSKNAIKNYSLESFYNVIKASKELDGKFLNIEGLAIDGDNMFLFNRGKNLVFQYSLKSFMNYVKTGKNYPQAKIYELKLPKIKGIEAGFSGATAILNQNKLIFTASIEDTSNPIDDGEVLGSFVGIIDLKDLKNRYSPICSQISMNNENLKIKVESIAISKQTSENTLEIFMVTDSDGGNSDILKAELKY